MGAFHNHPDFLYFRRDHPGRVGRASGLRDRAAKADPRRANRLRHPVVRLIAEYLFAYLRAIWLAPIGLRDRLRCTADLVLWLLGHVNPLRKRQLLLSPDPAVRDLGKRAWASRLTRNHDAVAPKGVEVGENGA